jgi:hypothetical protein
VSLEEAILEKVRSLPAAKQEEVLRFADGLQKRGPVRMAGSRDRSREMVWIKENRGDYSYQWVVVEGERLIALTRTHTRSLPPPKPWVSSFFGTHSFGRSAAVCSGLAACRYRSTSTFHIAMRPPLALRFQKASAFSDGSGLVCGA